MLGFVLAWLLGCYWIKKYHLNWTYEELSDYVFYVAIGVILGARLGQMLFFDPINFLKNPLLFFKIWQGGLSFHGGFIGGLITGIIYVRYTKRSILETLDLTVTLIPTALAMGRLGNFINGELWGRVTNVPWALIYPHVDDLPRHPSQLYEFFRRYIAFYYCLVICQ